MIYALHNFTATQYDDGEMPFRPLDYSLLKYGDDDVAKQFGRDLANGFFLEHRAVLMERPTVVIPSPYGYVENAATVMTRYFVKRLNELLVHHGGRHVDYSIIHRKVSYTHDYGFMSAENREALLKGDEFYLNEGFYRNKNLLFVDDIRITGAHENRLRGLLRDIDLGSARPMYLYYARLIGECRPEIEAGLNLHGIETIDQYIDLAKRPNHHVIVRPIKYLMSRSSEDFHRFARNTAIDKLCEIYHGCLGEGYYSVQEYQANFKHLKGIVNASIGSK